MTDQKDTDAKQGGAGGRTLSLKQGGGGAGAGGGRRRSGSSGGGSGGASRPKVVVEKKRKRISMPGDAAAKPVAKKTAPKKPASEDGAQAEKKTVAKKTVAKKPAAKKTAGRRTDQKGRQLKTLTDDERQARMKALADAKVADAERAKREAEDAKRRAEEEKQRKIEEEKRAKERAEAEAREAEEEKKRQAELDARQKAEDEARKKLEAEDAKKKADASTGEPKKEDSRGAKPVRKGVRETEEPAEEDDYDRRKAPPSTLRVKQSRGGPAVKQAKSPPSGDRRKGKLTINQALDEDGGQRARSLASIKRRREREKRQLEQLRASNEKITREVTIPEAITVQELANRMAERGAAVVKVLLEMGVMATINQTIDADTAELVVEEMGHKFKRVSESDVEDVIVALNDKDEDLKARAPVVTVMGHVDHGKTSLLDAFRNANVVAGEAGGITQHIGAYQVETSSGAKITFLDTPGHAAFTQMRARGASVTDIVILVVAANDGVMPQTIEAINHAKAAQVPIIVAVNKIDLPEANPDKVKQELLQHEVYVEDLGGDVQCVEVSAKNGTNLQGVEEAITLQAELLELKSNPDRDAVGTVVEAKLDKGRGPVATILVQHGTLKVGDVFVAGPEWGRVRALVSDKGDQIKEAGPSVPVEVLGLQGTPGAGDEFHVVSAEDQAREISEFRQRQVKQKEAAKGGSAASFEAMFAKLQAQEIAEVPVVIKADVQGSLEAIEGALEKLGTEEVQAHVLHSGVGGITETDISLASASGAVVIGFNVRANAQARDMAKSEAIEIRYYSVIYDLVDDVKAAMSGLLKPEVKEDFIGRADIKEVFSITKVGKIAGCIVTEGQAKAGAKVRLLRDDVVIHEGELSSLRRFKDEVKEVPMGTECGMQIHNYQDLKEGDQLELFEVTEIQRSL